MANENITIRQADISDLVLMMEWRMRVLHEVFALSDDYDTSKLYEANKAYYEHTFETGGHISCFAYEKDQIIGCGDLVLYQEMPSPDNPSGYCAYLMNIFVAKPYRMQGFGKSIVAWLVEAAKKRNITKIYLEASKIGEPMYLSLGFQKMEHMLHL